MKVQRGDIIIAEYPSSSGTGGKKRPVLIVQDDYYNTRISNVVVANITSNLKNAGDKAHYLIDVSTPVGVQSGLNKNSVVSCINLATLLEDRLEKKIGDLPDTAMQEIGLCLKAALGIP